MSLAQLEMLTRNRPGPHADQVGVRYSLLDAAVADAKRRIEEAFNAPCPRCGAHREDFDLSRWLHEPSRENPLAAAFAVNATKAVL